MSLDRLAERLCEYETVNGSEVTALLAEDGREEDGNALQGGSLAPDPSPWHVRHEPTRAAQGEGLAPKGSASIDKAGSGNGHQPTLP